MGDRVSVGMRGPGVDQSHLPDSRVFADPNADQDPLRGLHGQHVKGVPVEQWAVSKEGKAVIGSLQKAGLTLPPTITDEGAAEFAKRSEQAAGDRSMRIPTGTGDRIAEDPDDKRIVQMRDDTYAGLNIGVNPQQVEMDKHLPPGHTGLWIGKKREEQDGLHRGVLQYTPVMIPDGKGGFKRVELGGMYLASAPTKLKEQADRYYREQGAAKLAKVEEDQRAAAEKVFGGDLGRLASRKGRSEDLAGVVVEDGEAGDADLAHTLLEHMAE